MTPLQPVAIKNGAGRRRSSPGDIATRARMAQQRRPPRVSGHITMKSGKWSLPDTHLAKLAVEASAARGCSGELRD